MAVNEHFKANLKFMAKALADGKAGNDQNFTTKGEARVDGIEHNRGRNDLEVLQLFDGYVEELSGGTHGVVFAEDVYFAAYLAKRRLDRFQFHGLGLRLAFVPRGHDADCPDAEYFLLGKYASSMFFAERPSNELMQEFRRKEAAMKRHWRYDRLGRELYSEQRTALYRYARDVFNAAELTDEQHLDIETVVGGSTDTPLAERIMQADMLHLHVIMVILGVTPPMPQR